MDGIRRDRTSFIFARRFQAIRDAGRMIGRRKHTELLDQRGTYYEMTQA